MHYPLWRQNIQQLPEFERSYCGWGDALRNWPYGAKTLLSIEIVKVPFTCIRFWVSILSRGINTHKIYLRLNYLKLWRFTTIKMEQICWVRMGLPREQIVVGRRLGWIPFNYFWLFPMDMGWRLLSLGTHPWVASTTLVSWCRFMRKPTCL